MPYDPFLIKDISQVSGQFLEVHRGQAGLGEEAAGVHVLSVGCELVERADEFDCTVGLDVEGHGGGSDLARVTAGGCFDDPADFAELSDEFVPVGE
jgi:hypothetical protein